MILVEMVVEVEKCCCEVVLFCLVNECEEYLKMIYGRCDVE